jgi:serine/threonine protein phosphatase PrpC
MRNNPKPIHSLDSVVTNCACKTRTGEASGRPKKQNQDAYIISHLFAPAQGDYLFAVCDGHGLYGHEVSGFIKEQLPRMISSSCMMNTESVYERRLDKAVQGGFRKVVTKLEKSHIDIAYSGSTCVAVIVRGRSLLCANVGDSRAILLSKDCRDWHFEPLSTDHKPDIYKEKMRILSQGGRVSPYLGPRGEVLGPARVWLRNEDIPGLAMSRSIGDLVASSVGVSSEPEILERTLTPDDKMLILGSDGLWDYMSNEEVMRAASTYWGNGDLEGCCEHLVAEALGKWKREDDGIDDITVVVAFLQVPEMPLF